MRGFYKIFACGYAAIAIVLAVFLLALEVRLTERSGLRRMAFSGVEFAGTRLLDDISSDVTLDFLEGDPTLPRRFFSARWHGFLYSPEAALLELHGAGDDRLDVWIDDELVIRRTPPADMHTQVRNVSLAAGVHDIRVEYQQHGGAYNLRLEWAPTNGRPRSLSQRLLFFERPDDRDIQLAQRTTLLRGVVLVLWLSPAALGLVLVAKTRRRTSQRSSPTRWLRAALAVALGAVSLRALVARLPGWNPESLWVDDVIFGSLIRSTDLYSIVTIPTHHAPGLFVIWRGFYELFPDPEWSLQILPFASGIAAIPVMAFLGRRLTGDVALGVLAGAVTALNPLLAFYTVFVHQYSFEFLLTALFLLVATGLHSTATGIDPKRFGRMALCGAVGALFSVASLLISFPIVHLGAAFAVWNRRLQGFTMRRVLLWTAAYDVAVIAAVLFLRNRSTAATREWFSTWFMPLDSISAASGFLAVHGRKAVEMSMPNWTGQGVPEWDRPDTVSWPLLFIGVGLISLLARQQTRFLGLVATGIYAAVVVGSGLDLYPLGLGRTDVFTFPVGILLFTAGIWCVTEALPRPSAFRLLAAAVAVAMAVWYPVPVSYRPRTDVRLVNHLGANIQPDDWIMLSFSAGYLAAFYGPWDVQLAPSETSNGFVATIARDKVLHLPLRHDYHYPDQARTAAAEHRRIVGEFVEEQRPGRIWFLGYYAETVNGTDWAPNVLNVFTDNGYRVNKVVEATQGALYFGAIP